MTFPARFKPPSRQTGQLIGGIAAGILLLLLLVLLREEPARSDTAVQLPHMKVIKVQPVPFTLEARGFGVTRPAQTWQAVANVPGRVVERHPALESGKILPAGTLLLALDPSRYELAITEIKAELAALASDQSKLDLEEQNTRKLLKMEQERLKVAERELGRIEKLAAANAVSRSRLDEQYRATLAQRQAVQSLDNQIALLPSRREYLLSQIQRASVRLEQAQRDLEDTRFIAPYDLRITQVAAEQHQYVTAGQQLLLADSIAQAEVEAQIPLTMLRRIMTNSINHPARDNPPLDIAERLAFSAIDAEVQLVGLGDVSWPARVSRIASGLDPQTRAVRVVVTVDEPYRLANVPARPVLQRDMYVRVRLTAANSEPLLAIPSQAVHQGDVYLLQADNRLQRRPVTVAFEQRDLAVISEGLNQDDVVVVDDPEPVIAGMAIQPRYDTETEERLRLLALGQPL